MPKWLQIVLGMLVNAGTAYIATKYPAYLPVIIAGAAGAGVPLTVHAYNTNPKK